MENLKGQEKDAEKNEIIKEEGTFQFLIDRVISFDLKRVYSNTKEVKYKIKKEIEFFRNYKILIEEKKQQLIELSKKVKEEAQSLNKKRNDLEVFEEKMLKKFASSNSCNQADKNELSSYFQELYGKLEKERAKFAKEKEKFEEYKKGFEADIDKQSANYKEKTEKKVMENKEKDKIEDKKEEGDAQKENEEFDPKHEDKKDKEGVINKKKKKKRNKK